MLKLAIRSLLRHRVRNALTLAAVVFGVVAIILSGGFVEDVFVQLREVTIHSQLGHVQVHRKGFHEFGQRDPNGYLIDDPASLAHDIEAVERVERVAQRLHFSGLLSNGVAEHAVVAEGVEANKEAALGTFLQFKEGRNLADVDAYGIIVGQGVAGGLGLDVGSYVSLNATTLDGSLNSLEFEVVGIFQTFSKDFDDRAVRITLPSAQDLISTDRVHNLVVELESTEHTRWLAGGLRDALPADRFEVMTWFEMADFYRGVVALYDRQFAVLQTIVLLMVVLGVANSVNMAIFERTGEFGTQMALGDRRRTLFWQIITETAVLGVAGSIVGVALGVALAEAISSIGIPMPPPPNSNTGYIAHIRVVPLVLAQGFVVGILASVLAAILPARRTARLPIVEALRQNV